MPICEAFGSCVSSLSSLPTDEDNSCHLVFSTAFTLLLRLWRFEKSPLENATGDVTSMGCQQSPDYLLLVRNCKLATFGKSAKDQMKVKRFSKILDISTDPIFLDSFPRLKRWYRQHQECIVSSLCGLEEDKVHQVVDVLLNLMFRKINRSGSSLTPATSGSTNSTGSGVDDVSARLIPAWDVLEATPFVLDAALTACAHGRLSPRELATGLF